METTQAQIQEEKELLESYRKTRPIEPDKQKEQEPTPPAAPPADLNAPPPPVEPPAPEPPVEAPKQVTFEDTFKERFGKTIEEHEAELTELKTPKRPTFKNKKLEHKYEWVEEKNGDPDEYDRIHGTDWDKTSDDAVLMTTLKKENAALSDEELTELFNYKYKTGSDDEQEAKIANLLKKSDAAKAREAFKATQATATEPANVKEQADMEAAQKEQKRLAQKNWKRTVNNAISEFKEISEPIKTATGLEVDFKYVPDASEIASLKELMENPDTIFKSYLNKEGKIDMPSFMRDMAILKNSKKLMQNLVAQTEATFVKGKLKNTDFVQKPVGNPPAETDQQKMSRLAEAHFS